MLLVLPFFVVALWDSAPFWLVVPAISVAIAGGAFGFVRDRADRRAIRRRQRRQCVACGYSLHGNTSGVCPECGIAPSKLGRGG